MNPLATSIGTLQLSSPLLTGSGTFGHDGEALQFVSPGDLGALVLKTVTPEPRHGNPLPRLFETPAGLLNSIGLENRGVDVFLEQNLSALEQSPIPIIANAGGKSVSDYVRMVEAFDTCSPVVAIELNLSCPNVEGGSLHFATVPEALQEVVSACRAVTDKSLWAKLSPNVTRIEPLAEAAESAGADALTVCNTLLGLAVDWKTRRPRLGVGYGGFSGPAVHPVAMRMVRDCSQAVDLPLVASGGAATAEDVLQFLVAGASAVQLGTATFRDPALAATISKDLIRLLSEEGETVESLVGTLKWPS